MKYKFSIILILFVLTFSGFAENKNGELAKIRSQMNEINAMDLIRKNDFGLYYDTIGQLRKCFIREGTESEYSRYICFYGKDGNLIFIYYDVGNTVVSEAGNIYLKKGHIVLQNSTIYPYWEEGEDEIIVQGTIDNHITKTEGIFTYETPYFKIDLNRFAHVDSLLMYYQFHSEMPKNNVKINFSNSTDFIIFDNVTILDRPSLTGEVIGNTPQYVLRVIKKNREEIVENWGQNYWYEVEYGESGTGYIYGVFLEPIEYVKSIGFVIKNE